MKVKVRAYLQGMEPGEQSQILGTEANLGWDKPIVILSFDGAGAGISVQEALDMGLTEDDLRAANDEPQEFEIRLKRIPKP